MFQGLPSLGEAVHDLKVLNSLARISKSRKVSEGLPRASEGFQALPRASETFPATYKAVVLADCLRAPLDPGHPN